MSVKIICDYCKTEINEAGGKATPWMWFPLVLKERWSDSEGDTHTTTYHFHSWECLIVFARKKHADARGH